MALRILLVDENPAERRRLATFFAREPAFATFRIRICEADDGLKGLLQFQQHRPQLVITASTLARMDGVALCDAIRRLAFGKDQTIFICGEFEHMPPVKRRLRDALGVEVVGAPPVNLRQLAGRVLNALRERRQRDREEAASWLVDDDAPAREAVAGEAPPAAQAEPTPADPSGEPTVASSDAPVGAPASAPAVDEGDELDFGRALRGGFDREPLARLLVQAAACSATGTLKITRGKVRKVIYISEGKPIYIDSNLRNETLGAYLVARNTIDEEQLNRALRHARSSKKKLGEALNELELATPQVIEAGLQAQTNIKVASALRWRDGAFSWTPGDDFSDRVPDCPVEPVRLTLTALKRFLQADEVDAESDAGLVLTAAGERYRPIIDDVFGPQLLEQCDQGLSLRSVADGGFDRPTMATQVAALRITLLATFGTPVRRAVGAAPISEPVPAPEPEPEPAAAVESASPPVIPPALPDRASVISGGMGPVSLELPLSSLQPPGAGSEDLEFARESFPSLQFQLKDLDPTRSASHVPAVDLELLEPAQAEQEATTGLLHLESGVIDLGQIPGLELERRDPNALIPALAGGHQAVAPGERSAAGSDSEPLAEAFSVDPSAAREFDDLAAPADELPLVLSSRDDGGGGVRARPSMVTDTFGAELFFQEGQVKLRANDPHGACAAFELATSRNPEQADYHAYHGWARFLEQGRGEAGRAAARPLLERAFVISPDSPQAHELAARIESEVGDDDALIEHLEQALRNGPPRLDLFDQLKDALIRKEAFAELDHEYRNMIFRLRSSEPSKTVALWLDLAFLHHDKLGRPADAEMALDVASRLAPDDPRIAEARETMARQPAQSWQEAAEELRQRWLATPRAWAPLHELAQLHRQDGRDRQLLAVSALLVAEQQATSEERESYERLRPTTVRWPATELASLLTAVRHPADGPAMERFVGMVAPQLARVFPLTLEQLGSSELQMLADIGLPPPFRRVLSQLVEGFGFPPPRLYLSSAVEGLAPAPMDEPLLLVGQPLLDCDDEARLTFITARALVCLPDNRRHVFGRSTAQFRTAVLAALTLARPGATPADPGGQISAFRDALRDDGVDAAELQRLLRELDRKGRIDLSSWLRGVRQSCARVGMVLCGDPARALAGEKDSRTRQGLIAFALDPEYHALRRRLQLA